MTPNEFVFTTTSSVEELLKNKDLPKEIVDSLVVIQKEVMHMIDIFNEFSTKELPSEIVNRIKNTPLIDINGSKCFPDDISLSGHDISVWYCDPGNWEDDEENEEESVLTEDSIEVIKNFFKYISPRIKNIYIEDYHLADVKISMNIQ